MKIRMTVYSGPSQREPEDQRVGAVSSELIGAGDVEDRLMALGREYRSADYMPHRQVVVTLDPVTDPNELEVAREQLHKTLTAAETALGALS